MRAGGAVCLLLAAAAGAVRLDIPPRFMWGWGPGVSGFCGSMSLQTVGLYFGNYWTQNAIRGSTGGTDGAHELALENGTDSTCCASATAARRFHLNVEEWPYWAAPVPQAPAFLEWMSDSIDRGLPVVFGIFMSVESSPHYDHIVPLVGYERGDAGATALFFNDLYFNETLTTPRVLGGGGFARRRGACHGAAEHGGVAAYCLPVETNYGYRAGGNHDPYGELLPVRLALAAHAEPDYSKEDAKHRRPQRLTGVLTATGLAPSARYALLEYTSRAALPADGGFLASYPGVPEYFVAEGATWRRRVEFPSDATMFYRVVRA